MVSQECQHRHKDRQAPPFVLAHEISHKSHREREKRPNKPRFIVIEKIPSETVERHLNKVDKRLADKEKHKALNS